MSRRNVPFSILAAAILSLLPCGCNGPPRPDYSSLNLCDARGRVTLDGEPLAGALVLFEAQDLSFSYARTDDDGCYQLMFNSEKAGVSKGFKTVRIWSSRGIPGLDEAAGVEEEEDPDAQPKQPERVPARYNIRSELTVTVEGDSQTFDFNLES